MTISRRERLMATLRGEPVDRPAVSFYEIGGWTFDIHDPDPFNIYNSPEWGPLIRLAEEETDLIRMVSPARTPAPGNPRDEFFSTESYLKGGSRYARQTLTVAGRTMTSLTRRDPAVSTTWTIEHLLKDEDDLRAYLELPDEVFEYQVNLDPLHDAEEAVGDAGIVMVDTADPLCLSAALFGPAEYTVLALTEPGLFHRLLEKQAHGLYPQTETIAREFPGHLWRVVGSEYASEPFLPPRLYREYEVRYTLPMVEAIQRYGGYARLHSHGRLKNILPMIAEMGVAGLDPVEPPPQGDIRLLDVRRAIGGQTVLFGNIEASEIELLPPPQFEARVREALHEGTAGEGRGFVLMPSACPYGRHISPQVLANYETMVRLAQQAGSI
jgi:uroporphyrinogen-III decarboxylase